MKFNNQSQVYDTTMYKEVRTSLNIVIRNIINVVAKIGSRQLAIRY